MTVRIALEEEVSSLWVLTLVGARYDINKIQYITRVVRVWF